MNGLLDADRYFRFRIDLKTAALESFAEELFSASPAAVGLPGWGLIRLVYLRELGGGEFPFLLALPDNPPASKKSCFVGHRLLEEIEQPLRFNLAHVLTPYGIELSWSVQDLSAADLFVDVVSRIRGASMCFFDTYATQTQPNVFIEIGVAYALGIPMIVTEHVGGESDVDAKIPSDLQSLCRIRYRTYEELFRELYFGLPKFMSLCAAR